MPIGGNPLAMLLDCLGPPAPCLSIPGFGAIALFSRPRGLLSAPYYSPHSGSDNTPFLRYLHIHHASTLNSHCLALLRTVVMIYHRSCVHSRYPTVAFHTACTVFASLCPASCLSRDMYVISDPSYTHDLRFYVMSSFPSARHGSLHLFAAPRGPSPLLQAGQDRAVSLLGAALTRAGAFSRSTSHALYASMRALATAPRLTTSSFEVSLHIVAPSTCRLEGRTYSLLVHLIFKLYPCNRPSRRDHGEDNHKTDRTTLYVAPLGDHSTDFPTYRVMLGASLCSARA